MKFGAVGTIVPAADGAIAARLRARRTRGVVFGVRPEDIALAPPDDPRPGLVLPATFVEPIGPRVTLHFGNGAIRLKVVAEKRFATAVGRAHKLIAPEDKWRLFDPASGMAIPAEAAHVDA